MRKRLKTTQSIKEMISIRDWFYKYILLILTVIGGVGPVLMPLNSAEAMWDRVNGDKVCLACHGAVHSTGTISVAVDGTETSSATLSNDGVDSIELDWMFEGSTFTDNKEAVGVLIALPEGWYIESGTANSPSLTNWSSQWDNVDGGQSWVFLTDSDGDCPVGHECYAIHFSGAWDHDAGVEDMACNMGGTTCDGGSGGTDLDGVRNMFGTDAVVKTYAGTPAGNYSVEVYGIGHDGSSGGAHVNQTVNVTVNDSGTVHAQSPATIIDDNSNGGSVTWNTPGNAGAQDEAYAEALNMDGETSDYLKATNFGFSIPVGATINGIVVEVDRYAQDPNAVSDAEVKIVKNGVIGSENKGAAGFWPTSDSNTYVAYGGSSDLWNETWTAADINSANFGIVLSVSENGSRGDVFVDHIRIVVYYTDGANASPSLTIDEPAGGNDSVEQGQSFNIQYDLSDAEDVATVDFYYETDGNGSGGTAIAACQNQGEVVSSGTLDITAPANASPSLTIDEPAGGNDSVEQGQSFNIQYDLSDAEDVATVDFYYETDGNGSGGTAIAACQNQGELCLWGGR
jgi:hypothetical protein